MNKLLISANFNIGHAQEVPRPDGYEVTLKSVGRKGSSDLAFLLQEVVAIGVVLQQVGLEDWIKSKSYDYLWTYIRTFIFTLGSDGGGPNSSVTVKDRDGHERVAINGITPDNIDKAFIEVREILEEKNDGTKSREFAARIDFRNN